MSHPWACPISFSIHCSKMGQWGGLPGTPVWPSTENQASSCLQHDEFSNIKQRSKHPPNKARWYIHTKKHHKRHTWEPRFHWKKIPGEGQETQHQRQLTNHTICSGCFTRQGGVFWIPGVNYTKASSTSLFSLSNPSLTKVRLRWQRVEIKGKILSLLKPAHLSALNAPLWYILSLPLPPSTGGCEGSWGKQHTVKLLIQELCHSNSSKPNSSLQKMWAWKGN